MDRNLTVADVTEGHPLAAGRTDVYPPLADGTPAPLKPSEVKPIRDEDIAYILDGDGYGMGGHRGGTGLLEKSEFPVGWTNDTVRIAVEAGLWIPTLPRNIWRTNSGVQIRAIYEDIIIALPITQFPDGWELMTAYPLSGDGVYRNTLTGRAPVPLNLDHITRILDL
jgi:hypothetical protein